VCSPKIAGVPLYVVKRIAVNVAILLVQHWRIYPFTIGSTESVALAVILHITPIVSPATIGNRTEQYIKPIGNKKYKLGSSKKILVGQRATPIDWKAAREI
jgi:hypothetical protein